MRCVDKFNKILVDFFMLEVVLQTLHLKPKERSLPVKWTVSTLRNLSKPSSKLLSYVFVQQRDLTIHLNFVKSSII